MRRWVIVAVGLGLAGTPALAQPTTAPAPAAEPESESAAAAAAAETIPTISAAVDTAATTVGGRIRLTLDVDIPEGWFVTPGEPAAELGSFRARRLEEVDRTASHRQFVYTLVATQAGDVEIPSVTMRATRGDDPEGVEIASPSVAVHVASNLPASAGGADPAEDPAAGLDAGGAPGVPGPGTEAEPAPLKPALEAPRDWRPVWIAAAVALLTAIAGFFFLRWLRKRRRAPEEVAAVPRAPARPAWEIALEELDAIAAARWVDQGELARQYEAVTETVRRYLENRYGVPALESTTDELRERLRSAPIPSPIAARVLSLLSEADLVKFAKGIPDPADARTTEPRARQLVEETMPARAQEVAA